MKMQPIRLEWVRYRSINNTVSKIAYVIRNTYPLENSELPYRCVHLVRIGASNDFAKGEQIDELLKIV